MLSQKNPLNSFVDPAFSPSIFPYFLRTFCCMVCVKYQNNYNIGSGILTHHGIISAYHLAKNKQSIEDIFAIFLTRHGVIVCLGLENPIYSDESKDVVLFPTPKLNSNLFRPVEIPTAEMLSVLIEKHIIKNRMRAFGCPHGILGVSWKPKYVAHSENEIYTSGFACPGVSGGGILVKYGRKWYVVAIHSGCYMPSRTLKSTLIHLEQIEEGG